MTDDKYYQHGISSKTLDDVYRIVSSIDEKIDVLHDEVSDVLDAQNDYYATRDMLGDYDPDSPY